MFFYWRETDYRAGKPESSDFFHNTWVIGLRERFRVPEFGAEGHLPSRIRKCTRTNRRTRSQFCADSSTVRLVFSRVAIGSRRYLCTRRRSNRVNEPAPITGPWHVPAICYISIDKSTPFRFRVREIYVTVSYIITVRTDVDCSVARSENIFVFFRVGNSRRFGNEKF